MCIKICKNGHKTDIEMKKNKLKSSIKCSNHKIGDFFLKIIWTVQALHE